MFDELGSGDVIDHATQPNPETRDLPVGEAINARGLNGLGLITQARSLVPRFFQQKPTSRLMAPRGTPAQLHDAALGRALDPRYAHGVTALDSRMAATAAMRLACTPTVAPLDRTSLHVDGRDNREAEPEPELMHSTRGDRRDHRPARNHVRLAFVVEPQAGMPIRMPPLRGNRSAAHEFGQLIKEHSRPLQTTDGLPSLVAERAL